MSLNRIQDNKKYGGGQYGVVYTKPEVVKFILDEVGYMSSSNLSSVTIMEPSCGEGEFLLEIVSRLKSSSQLFNFDFNQAYHNCVFASEIDAEKVKACCERLKIEFPELINVEENIIVEDYLLSRHNQVDIVVGNPPYQIMDGGAKASASPVYHLFVETAIKIRSNYLSMIMPARWYSGGKGLDSFRNTIMKSNKIKKLFDYFDPNDIFPGIDISGGVCYFLYDNSFNGLCEVNNFRNGIKTSLIRPLLENGETTFVRFNEATKIMQKINLKKDESFVKIVSSRKPFGLDTKPTICRTKSQNNIKIFAYPENGYIKRDEILSHSDWVDKYKVYISYAYGERGDFPYFVLGKPFFGEKNTCCSETYLVIGPFETEAETKNCISYIRTKFFRFLVLQKKNTQHATSKVYSEVPLQDFSHPWTDEELYEKYGLDLFEREYIESLIKPMD